jgi:hypothetical protein
MDALAGIDVRRIGQSASRFVDPPVLEMPFHGIAGLRPFALHPFEVGEPRAVLVFVDHARRQERQVPT